ncbi:SLC13 family permease [Luteimonas terrae]|uniref:Di/tricarboxylate transporter n=1 Tax=Luteimonas terrae TaxID=1530191 RepID=A0ABU1XZR9_9GAMM|nr:SLC13 family permease [Luteimonas terrae]MDR7194260.1 di/tricarboxylate transporter [Luteimonas terrae]
MDLWLTLAVMAGAVFLFVTEKLRVDVVALLVAVSLLVLGVVTLPEALSGFSNQATVMVAAMFVLSGALQRNGALIAVGDLLARIRWKWLFLLVMMSLVAGVAAFVNNTATVAVFLPLVLAATTANRWAPSKFLIPLSYISQAAGVCTLIGTSTNLLVDSMAREADAVGFTLFEFAPLGIVFVGICMVYLMTVGRLLLPDRGVPGSATADHIGRYVAELLVAEGAAVIGRQRSEVLPDGSNDVTVLEILRNGAAVRGDDVRVEAGDRLLLRGLWQDIDATRKSMKLKFDHVARDLDGDLNAERLHVEAMVAPGSHLIGHTLAGMRFGHTYRARVHGLHRRQLGIRQPLDQVPLHVGDVLLLDAPVKAIADLRIDRGLIVMGSRAQRKVDTTKATLSAIVMAAAIAAAALGWMSIVASALLGCVALVVLRLLDPDEAYEAIDWRVILLLAGIIPLGIALQKTGGAVLAADQLINLVGHYGPTATLAAIYLMTSTLTEFMSNNASAVLLVPIAIATADSLGVDPKPFLIAVAFAASTSFATPISYQTNTMVYTAGNYRFSDFVKIGMPLNIIFLITATLLIPRFFPF